MPKQTTKVFDDGAGGTCRGGMAPAAVLLCALAPMLARSQPAATSQPAPAREVRERTLLDWYWAGGVFMHPIALCSVVALAIVVERLITLRRSNTAPADFLPGLKHTMRDLNTGRDAGLAYCRGQDHALARVVAARHPPGAARARPRWRTPWKTRGAVRDR